MAKHISTLEELEKALQPRLERMVDELAERVYEILNYFLNEYYTGWTPNSYSRTEAFLRSAVKTKAISCRDGAKASVYIDYESMNNYVNVTGYQVATWANTGTHSGLSVSHKPHVWDDTMDETINNGSLLNLAIQYLKSKGFSVRA